MSRNLMPEILKLSVEDRIALVDEIYASFDAESAIPANHRKTLKRTGKRGNANRVLPGHQAELERRFAEYNANPSIAIPIEKTLAKMRLRK